MRGWVVKQVRSGYIASRRVSRALPIYSLEKSIKLPSGLAYSEEYLRGQEFRFFDVPLLHYSLTFGVAIDKRGLSADLFRRSFSKGLIVLIFNHIHLCRWYKSA